MAKTSLSHFEANLDDYMDRIEDENLRLTVKIGRGKAVVVMSEDEYTAMMSAIENPASRIESE